MRPCEFVETAIQLLLNRFEHVSGNSPNRSIHQVFRKFLIVDGIDPPERQHDPLDLPGIRFERAGKKDDAELARVCRVHFSKRPVQFAAVGTGEIDQGHCSHSGFRHADAGEGGGIKFDSSPVQRNGSRGGRHYRMGELLFLNAFRFGGTLWKIAMPATAATGRTMAAQPLLTVPGGAGDWRRTRQRISAPALARK